MYSTKGRNRKFLLLEGYWVKTLSTLTPQWNCKVEIAGSSYYLIIWTHLNFQNSSFKNTDLSSFFKVSNFSLLLLLHVSIQKCYFSSIQWNSEWPGVTEIADDLDMPRYSIWIFFTSTSFIFLSTFESVVFNWGRLFIPINHKICLLHRTWSPDWPNVGKLLLVLNYLNIPNRPSRKQHFWFRLSRSELEVKCLRMLRSWNKFWLRPLDWIADKLNMQKASSIVVSRSIFKLNTL